MVGSLISWVIAFSRLFMFTLVLWHGPSGRMFTTPPAGMGLTSIIPEKRSLSQATATIACGFISRVILRARVPPVTTEHIHAEPLAQSVYLADITASAAGAAGAVTHELPVAVRLLQAVGQKHQQPVRPHPDVAVFDKLVVYFDKGRAYRVSAHAEYFSKPHGNGIQRHGHFCKKMSQRTAD